MTLRRELLQAGAAAAAGSFAAGLQAAQSPEAQVPKKMKQDPLARLKALNARFIHNFVTNDVKSHSAMLHERFLSITAKGKKESREDYLKRWATGFDPKVVVYWDYRDEQLGIFGNVALVRATNKQVVRKDGVETSAMTTYTDTYLHEKGDWKCIQAQIGPVAPEYYPADETIVKKYVMGQIQE